jgi:murein DD-endopeptidase MepM/ murein hydrolase activator NlpD
VRTSTSARAGVARTTLALIASALAWAIGAAASSAQATAADEAAPQQASAPSGETDPDPTGEGTPEQTGEGTPGQTSAPTGGSDRMRRLRLRLEDVTPRKIFFQGSEPARFRYEIAGRGKRDLVIEVVRKGKGGVVRRWNAKNVEAGATHSQSWGGKTEKKRSAPSGTYLFRVRERGGELAKRSRARGRRSFGYYDHVFPIAGNHAYGDGIGAPRQGHSHQGLDVFAECGAPLRAARGGKVQFRGYQGSGAGHYLVIDGKQTGRDYVYMHMQSRSRFATGDRVRTRQRIGAVGASGNASGCHLHFELWSKPGWYQGGHFLDPKKPLKKWDRWS